jgi:hypothetical protein
MAPGLRDPNNCRDRIPDLMCTNLRNRFAQEGRAISIAVSRGNFVCNLFHQT